MALNARHGRNIAQHAHSAPLVQHYRRSRPWLGGALPSAAWAIPTTTSAYNTRMAALQIRYFVRLRPDLSLQDASEFRAFAKKPPSGKPPSDLRLILACGRIDLTHNVFAKLTIDLEEGAPPIDLWVPYQMILMIGDVSEMGRAPVVFTPTE
jgi:hypothetical protein